MGTKKVTVGILHMWMPERPHWQKQFYIRTGMLRRLGRVDHQDAFLDTDAMERARGITIFSKQAKLELGDFDVTLLDTPGHVDFSAEMERTLQVLDYAVLVISGADGVQGHVETLWRLLSRYQIPTVLFINKMDQEGTEEDTLLLQLQKQLNEHCIKVCSMPQQPDNADTAPGISLLAQVQTQCPPCAQTLRTACSHVKHRFLSRISGKMSPCARKPFWNAISMAIR